MKNILSILAVAFGLTTTTTQAQSNFINDRDQIPPATLLKYIEVRETALEYQIFDQQIAFAPISLESWSANFPNTQTNEILTANDGSYLENSIPTIETPKSVKITLFGYPLGEFTAQQLMHHEPGLLGNSLLAYRF